MFSRYVFDEYTMNVILDCVYTICALMTCSLVSFEDFIVSSRPFVLNMFKYILAIHVPQLQRLCTREAQIERDRFLAMDKLL